MVNLNFSVRWPFSDRFRNIWCRHWSTPWQYKFVEAQIYASSDVFAFEFNYSRRTDHAGLHIGLGFLGYNFDFNFYDSRHWDDKQGKWQD